MTKEELIKYIDCYESIDKFISDLNHKFNINLYDTVLYDRIGELLDIVINTNYDTEGSDTLAWWIFDKDCGRGSLCMYDENGEEMCKDFDELYNYLKQHERV